MMRLLVLVAILVCTSSVQAQELEAGISVPGLNCEDCARNPLTQLREPARAFEANGSTSLSSRTQLESYTNADLKIFEDPMTEAVKIFNSTGWGTGYFLPECRIMTDLHVLLSLKHGRKTSVLREGESLKGDIFTFETRPLPGTEKTLIGRMRVIEHGRLYGGSTNERSLEDWAIGYDEECLSETSKLGYVRIAPGVDYFGMEGKDFFTAGFSIVEAAFRDGQYRLYVDPKCRFSENVKENKEQTQFMVTNCAVGNGGSGQFLLRPKIVRGEIVMGINGWPQKMAYGMYQKNVAATGVEVPDGLEPSGFAIFNDYFYGEKLAPHLKGPPKFNTLSARNGGQQ